MKNNFVLYITNFSTLEGSLITHQDLFENLNDNFENFIIVNWTNLTFFNKKKYFFDIKTKYKIFNPLSISEFKNFCKNKNILVISNFGKTYGTFRIYYALKKLSIPILMISNIGNPSGGAMIRSIKHPIKFIESYFKKHFYQNFTQLLMIIGILPKVEIRFISNKKIIENIKKSKFKSFLLNNNLFAAKRIELVNSRTYDAYKNQNYKISEDYIVHLDASLNYKEEIELRGALSASIIEKHYYYLSKFLTKLSTEFNKEVVVCIHPGYDLEHHQFYLKKFNVIKFKTREYVYKSFITTNFDSSAIEDAIFLKKKIIGFKSKFMTKNEIEHSRKYANIVGYYFADIIKDYDFEKDDLLKKISDNINNYDKHINSYHNLDPNISGLDKIINIIKERFFNN